MKTEHGASWLAQSGIVAALTAIFLTPVFAVRAQDAADPGWPRELTEQGKTLVIYQPQVDGWPEHKLLELRAAISVKRGDQPATADREVFGVIQGKSPTTVDGVARTVTLSGLQYTVRFPGATAAESAELEQIVRGFLPGTRTLTVALDRVLAYLDDANTDIQREAPVSLEAPPIYYSPEPAILVMFLGAPRFKPVAKSDPSLLFATNTNWDVFLSPTDSKYYLLNEDSWLSADDPLHGPWTAAGALPKGLQNLPKDENWSETRQHIPGSKPEVIPDVIATSAPAELILTDGDPQLRPIAGTKLMQISNTPSLVFFYGPDQRYYYLVAGRWFRAAQLDGPWSAATLDLPADFAAIPSGDDAAEARVSVQGTPEAQDAVLLASVPQKTSVKKSAATLTVEYSGDPKFAPVATAASPAGTAAPAGVQYAVNTLSDVFLVNGRYYCCSDGVWFTASSPTGPWTLCADVPQSIYSIPADHPKHNVTYVHVYDDQPDTITYGYTSGYTGLYVASGLLVYGAGMATYYDDYDDDDEYYYRYPVPYYSYGVGAHYNYAYGGYYRAGYAYGPYGGAGRAAYYNPATGTYGRGAYRYGPYGGAAAREAYNPWTDTYAARAKVQTPYGWAGRFYAERGGTSVQGGSRSGAAGSVGWAQSSEGGKAVAWDTPRNEGAAVKTKGGDVYVGNDGNVYRRQDGEWQKYDSGGWASHTPTQGPTQGPAGTDPSMARYASAAAPAGNKPAQLPADRAAAQPQTGDRTAAASSLDQNRARPSTQSASQPRMLSSMSRSSLNSLEGQACARSWGNSNTQRAQSAPSASRSSNFSYSRSSSATRSAPSRSGGRSGGRR